MSSSTSKNGESDDDEKQKINKDQDVQFKWLKKNCPPQLGAHFSRDTIMQDVRKTVFKEIAYLDNILSGGSTMHHVRKAGLSQDAEVCRICLATDVKMYSVTCGILKTSLEWILKVAGCSDKHSIESLSQHVCFECAARLIRCHELIKKSKIARKILLDVYAKHGQITKCLVEQQNREELNLQSTLGIPKVSPVFNYEYDEKDNNSYVKPSPEMVLKVETNEIGIFDECEYVYNDKGDNENWDDMTANLKLEEPCGGTPTTEIEDNFQACSNLRAVDVKENCYFLEDFTDSLDLFEDSFDYQNSNLYSNDENKSYDAESETNITNNETPDVNMIDKINKRTGNKRKQIVTEEKTNKNKKMPRITSRCMIVELSAIKKINNQIRFENTTKKRVLKKSITKRSKNNTYKTVNIPISNLSIIESDRDDGKCEATQTLNKRNLERTKQGTRIERNNIRSVKNTKKKGIVTKLHNNFNIVTLTEQIERYLNSVPNDDTYYQCDICSKKFKYKNMLSKHIFLHDPIHGPFECAVCRCRFKSRKKCSQHIARLHKFRYHCKICPRVFNGDGCARKHVLRHAGVRYHCSQCAFSSSSDSMLSVHRRKHANAHHCVRCGESFVGAIGLKYHVAKKHQFEEENPAALFKCEVCDIDFTSEKARRFHMISSEWHKNKMRDAQITETVDLRTTCNRCGSSFDSRPELEKHKLTEHPKLQYLRDNVEGKKVNLYPMKCDCCDEMLRNSHKHYWHMRRVHNQNWRPVKNANHICPTCGRGFESKLQLNAHELRHGSPALGCPRCPRRFYDKNSLKAHSAIHEPQRPHACALCPRAFKAKCNLVKHQLVHTGERAFPCPLCQKRFSSITSANLHVRTVHQGQPHPPRNRRKKKTD